MMLLYNYKVVLFLTAFIYWTRCELQPVERRSILQQCESNINTSLALDKDDRLLIANWTAEFQVRQVNVTAHYRLEMTRHRERSFRMVHLNTKWKECLRLHNREVRMSKITYYEREGECLKTANSDDGGRRKTVDQVEKEIKKWRKSYKYLSNLCDANNPGDKEESEQCLAEYIKNDNYHATFERLIVLKLEAMSELLERFNSCLSGLEECLRRCFSDALQNVRTVMVVLNQCYKSSKDE